jgi:hypothetical protein
MPPVRDIPPLEELGYCPGEEASWVERVTETSSSPTTRVVTTTQTIVWDMEEDDDMHFQKGVRLLIKQCDPSTKIGDVIRFIKGQQPYEFYMVRKEEEDAQE